MRHAELVALEARADVRVGLGIDVRVHADADRGRLARFGGDFTEHLQFGFAFDVEAQNARLQCLAHFGACFAHAGEDHLGRVAACGQNAFEFTAGDDVEPATLAGKELQHGQRGVGLHGVADMELASGETALVGRQCLAHGGRGIDEQRCAMRLGEVAHAHVFNEQFVVAVGNMGMAGQCGGSHGVAEEAGADGEGAWDGMGVSVWGSVARCADAGSVGRCSGPR